MHNFLTKGSKTVGSQLTIHNVGEGELPIDLPLSKSVRARELVLDALAGNKIEIENENDDIFVLSRALNQCTIFAISENNQACLDCRAEQKSQPKEVMHNAQLDVRCELDLHHSGTALRFLTAYCAVTEGEWVLTGSERLCERPISPLVDALRRMGADVEYEKKDGFAPLRVRGRKLQGGCVRLDASVSSQFASALMLIADKVEGGVELEYEGDVVSKSYIRLTEMVIERYKSGTRYSGERDWSSATVWYAVMAILKRGKFLLEGLSIDSCQPDRDIVEVFEKLGVITAEAENGVAIESKGDIVEKMLLDCKNMPDAVMYIVVTACLLGVEFEINGVKTLKAKESNRIEALMIEMRKCGYVLKYDEIGKICWLGERCDAEDTPSIRTYNDHRIAMAMAVVGLVMNIEIENPEVVNKSYPNFWKELDKLNK